MAIEVIWEQLLGRGLEHLILEQDGAVDANGIAVGMLEGTTYRIQYQVSCDADWSVRQFRVRNLLNNEGVSLTRRGNDWLDEAGTAQAELAGCTEVDIMVTPFTNTLPIRRLKMQPGQAQQISVVYVSVPDLKVSKAEQVYTCIKASAEGGVFRYHSPSSGFTANLTVDADQVVTDYAGIFRLVWKKG